MKKIAPATFLAQHPGTWIETTFTGNPVNVCASAIWTSDEKHPRIFCCRAEGKTDTEAMQKAMNRYVGLYGNAAR